MDIMLHKFPESTWFSAIAALKAYRKNGNFTKGRIGSKNKVSITFEGLQGAIEVYHTDKVIHLEYKPPNPSGEYK